MSWGGIKPILLSSWAEKMLKFKTMDRLQELKTLNQKALFLLEEVANSILILPCLKTHTQTETAANYVHLT